MKRCRRLLHRQGVIAILVVTLLCPLAVQSATRDLALDAWMTQTLIPGITDTLVTHPRFRDETIQFVVIDNGEPAALTNALAIGLRDQLRDAVLEQHNDRFKIAWHAANAVAGRLDGSRFVDCTAQLIDYYVGLELTDAGDGVFTVGLVVLDTRTHSRVGGFADQWTGRLSRKQFQAFRQPRADPAFLGERETPYDDSQTDLLAAHLAHDLGCSLLQELSGEYVARAEFAAEQSAHDLLPLISNNLAAYQALQLTDGDEDFNATIRTRLHPVDGDLYQYWVTVTPVSPVSELPTINASAYTYLPDPFLPVELAVVGQPTGLTRSATLIGDLRIVQMHGEGQCERLPRSQRRERCFALQTNTDRDAIVFVLYHQQNNGLVRLADQRCSSRAAARVARQQETLLVPLPIDAGDAARWSTASDWLIEPDTDTFYVVATGHTQAARALAAHFGQLPQRCGNSLRPGLESGSLRQWFRELHAIADHWSGDIDWQSVRIRDVY